MDGSLNTVLNELNLSLPDTNGLNVNIKSDKESHELEPGVQFTICILFLLAIFILVFTYLNHNGMSVASFFGSLKDKLRAAPGTKISSNMTIAPK
mgnify:CR=1 FL=1